MILTTQIDAPRCCRASKHSNVCCTHTHPAEQGWRVATANFSALALPKRKKNTNSMQKTFQTLKGKTRKREEYISQNTRMLQHEKHTPGSQKHSQSTTPPWQRVGFDTGTRVLQSTQKTHTDTRPPSSQGVYHATLVAACPPRSSTWWWCVEHTHSLSSQGGGWVVLQSTSPPVHAPSLSIPRGQLPPSLGCSLCWHLCGGRGAIAHPYSLIKRPASKVMLENRPAIAVPLLVRAERMMELTL